VRGSLYFALFVPRQNRAYFRVSRLFYPILFSVTASLAATLWMRHGLPMQWLTALGAAVAQAQTPALQTTAPRSKRTPPPWKIAPTPARGGTQRLPPTNPLSAKPTDAGDNQATAEATTRTRQAPYTQLQIEPPGDPRAMEVTRPVPVASAKVVAQVGNEIILAADVLPEVNEKFQQEMKHCPKEQHEQLFQALMFQSVKQAVQAKIVVAAMKDGIPADKLPEMEKEVLKHFEETQLQDLKKRLKVRTDAELEAKLKEQGSSLKRQRQAFLDMVLISEWQRKEIKFDEHISHLDMIEYYDKHLDEYKFPAKVRFEEIRIGYGRRRGKREAYNTIHKLGNQVYAGARMADIAKSHSEGLNADKGGLHDWTSQGSIKCDDLDAALFSLPIGVLSEVIDDGRALIVVRVLERTEAGVTGFGAAQAGIKEKIKAQRQAEARTKKFTEFFEKELPRAWTIYDDHPLLGKKASETKRR
jgi:parvulin-like peptidyl-prolyl isomerase